MIRPALTLGASCARQSLRAQLPRSSVRHASSSAGGNSSSSNLPLVLGLGGLAGLGGWYALGGFDSADKAKASAVALKDKAESEAKSAVGSVTGALDKNAFKEFTLKEIKPYNHDSSILVFELPDNQKPGMVTASAVLLKAAGEGLKGPDGKEVIRPYTPISTPDTAGHIDFLIKRYENGNMSKHATDLKVGDKLAIKGPIAKFPYKANEFEEVVCIGGGSGITPLYQLVQAIRDNPEDKTKYTLIYTNKSEQDILLREEFDKLAKEKPEQYKVLYGLDTLPNKNFNGFEGYITPELLSKHLPPPAKADAIKIFVCGPPPQVAAISGGKGPKGSQGELKGLLADAGYQPSQVYKF